MPSKKQPEKERGSIADPKKEFIRLFNKVGYTKSRYDLFRDFLNLSFFSLCKLSERGERADQLEENYMQVVRSYPEKDLHIIRETMPRLLGLTDIGVNQKMDFLGAVYHDLEIHNKEVGQFFTPFSVSYMMAKMTLSEQIEHIKAGRKKHFTLDEPASGAGGMILASAQALEDEGLDSSATMFFRAIDLSEMAFKMTYIQTALRGLCGFVIHGNSLSLETFDSRITPAGVAFFGMYGDPFKNKGPNIRYRKKDKVKNPKIRKRNF